MKKPIFKWIYLAFAALLAVLMLAAILYVRGLLADYEAARPERQAELAIELLAKESQEKDYWEKFDLPDVDEQTKAQFIALCQSEDLSYIAQTGRFAEDEMGYIIRKGSFPLAEVLLKAQGPAETKLAVFTTREWAVEKVVPLLEEREYTATLPEGFKLWADGKELAPKAEGGKAKFTLSGVYLEPQFKVAAADGTDVGYTVKNFRVIPDIYEYSLTLPATIKVEVDGEGMEGMEGTLLPSGRIKYDILRLEKPSIILSDLYGNQEIYDGKTDLPLTHKTIRTPAGYAVTLEGKAVAGAEELAPEYEILEGLVKDLPKQVCYEIAILKADAAIAIADEKGEAVTLDQGLSDWDLTTPLPKEQEVPKEIAAKVNVLRVAQNWSLFMSNDRTFAQMAEQMLPDSYQYEVAKKYSTSIDKQFFASHSLLSPAFTENKVSNFQRITADCFAVEVQFVKHMRLTNGGKLVDDAMNDRFYFVRSGDRWLLAGLKEVAEDGK